MSASMTAPIEKQVKKPVLLDPTPTEVSPQNLSPVPHYPSEVQVLLELVRQLPPTVSSQDGALIIRATLDRMGGSLASVLRQAQDVQNDCLTVVRDYLDDIERCQERIRILEASSQHCQDKATELSNLIDLFLLVDSAQTHPAG